jgi:hypothetical protein
VKRLIHSVAGPVGRLRIFAALTIGSAAAISFDSIRHLAEVAGFGPLSWLFPLTLDAVAAYGMDLWVRRSVAAGPAKWLALAAIFGSLVANVADHYLTQRSVLGGILGAVPPAMLAALLAVAHKHASGTADQTADRWTAGPLDHPVPIGPMPLWSMVQFPDGTRAPTPVVHDGLNPDHQDHAELDQTVVPLPRPRRRTSAAGRPREAGTASRTARLHSDEDIRVWIKNQRDRPTKKAVMDQFKVGSSKALRLINDVKGPISDG